MKLLILFICIVGTSSLIYRDEILVEKEEKEEIKEDPLRNAYSPLVPCHFL